VTLIKNTDTISCYHHSIYIYLLFILKKLEKKLCLLYFDFTVDLTLVFNKQEKNASDNQKIWRKWNRMNKLLYLKEIWKIKERMANIVKTGVTMFYEFCTKKKVYYSWLFFWRLLMLSNETASYSLVFWGESLCKWKDTYTHKICRSTKNFSTQIH
jgi:hypothetical protein